MQLYCHHINKCLHAPPPCHFVLIGPLFTQLNITLPSPSPPPPLPLPSPSPPPPLPLQCPPSVHLQYIIHNTIFNIQTSTVVHYCTSRKQLETLKYWKNRKYPSLSAIRISKNVDRYRP